jgi:hypothetical protein
VVEPTAKESLRYAQKANRRARKWNPTIEDFEQAAQLGDIRLTEALIARYTTSGWITCPTSHRTT